MCCTLTGTPLRRVYTRNRAACSCSTGSCTRSRSPISPGTLILEDTAKPLLSRSLRWMQPSHTDNRYTPAYRRAHLCGKHTAPSGNAIQFPRPQVSPPDPPPRILPVRPHTPRRWHGCSPTSRGTLARWTPTSGWRTTPTAAWRTRTSSTCTSCESARDAYTTYTMHTHNPHPCPVIGCNHDEEQEREHRRSARDAREVRALRRQLALPAGFLARLRGPGHAAPH